MFANDLSQLHLDAIEKLLNARSQTIRLPLQGIARQQSREARIFFHERK